MAFHPVPGSFCKGNEIREKGLETFENFVEILLKFGRNLWDSPGTSVLNNQKKRHLETLPPPNHTLMF